MSPRAALIAALDGGNSGYFRWLAWRPPVESTVDFELTLENPGG